MIISDKTLLARAEELTEAREKQDAQLKRSRSRKAEPVVSVTGKDDIADALAIREMEQILRGVARKVAVGAGFQAEGEVPVIVTEIPRRGTNRIVAFGSGGAYIDIVEDHLGGIAGRHERTDKVIASAFLEFVISGTLPKYLDQKARDAFGRTRRLIITVETNRLKTQLADLALALEAIEKRIKAGKDSEEAFGALAETPAAAHRAVKASERASAMAAGDEFQEGTLIEKRAREIIRRHVAQVDEVIPNFDKQFKPFGDKQLEPAAKLLAGLIRKRLLGGR
jgi:hypothetical protein